MIRRIFTMLTAFMSLLCTANAQTCADLQVTSLTINTVSGNRLTYTYVLKNVGTATLYLNRMYYQAYVSQNSVYDTSDQPAGGSIFGDNAPALAPGQSYTSTSSSNPFVSITTYPYLVFRVLVRSGFSMPECSTANNTVVKYIGCNLADVDITSIAINGASGNSFNFTLNLKNLGWAGLPLSKLYFQAWVSTDLVLDASDKPAGGSIFGSTAPTLAKDGTFSRTWTSNPSVSITTYKYVIVEIREITSGTVPECNLVNNVQAQAIGCNLADLDVSGITINSIAGNSFNFTFTVRNLGWAELPLSKMYFQAWVSTDLVLDASDKPAGGAIFGSTAPSLAKNGTFSRTWTSNPTVPIATYKYLILEVRELTAGTVPECNVANNVERKLIVLLAAAADEVSVLESEAAPVLRADYDKADQNMYMSASHDSEVNYRIFRIDGQRVADVQQGAFVSTKELSLSQLCEGLYVVNICDGHNSITHKFVIVK